jgi:putative thioredoxin
VAVTVIDVNEADFDAEVIERSRREPVVVDFWAAWCGPCRQLGPLLESAAGAREGKVTLAKLDTDANPRLAGAYGIQGIPAVKAFRDGVVVAEFVGAQPRPQVEEFFDALVPSEVDALVAAGDEASLRRALELEPGRGDAAVALARILFARADLDAAEAALADAPSGFEVDGLRARVALARDGVLADAFAAIDTADQERAFELLLGAIAEPNGRREEIRMVLVGELARLPATDPLARETRRRMATALF